MKIKEVEVIPLYDPNAEMVKSTCVIRVLTDEGIEGIGQVELPAMIAKSFIKTKEWESYWSPGLERILLNEDPLNVERLWQKMYASMWLYGRRGAGIAVLTGIDTALWDIKGKLLGRPVYDLIWSSSSVTRVDDDLFGPKKKVKPYATVYPSGNTPEEVAQKISLAIGRGFHAAKLEEQKDGFGRVSAELDEELVAAARDAVGESNDLMVDVQYAWQDYSKALETIRKIEKYRPYFVEAPLPPDSLEAYAKLSSHTDVKIALGDGGFTTRYEFLEIMDKGAVDVVQPSSVRSGGITETLRIAAMAYLRGLLCVPHCYAWKIGVAASIHVAAVVPNMPYIEMPSPEPHSPLVSQLLTPDIEPNNGLLEVPNRPGLGFELNEKTLEKYRVEAF
jgi:L-alanine-DL-glutamate epimerase-like enolase superfamily enzyme